MNSAKPNSLPPALFANLQNVLTSRKGTGGGGGDAEEVSKVPVADSKSNETKSSEEVSSGKPIILVTNGDGIGAPGLFHLVGALVRDGKYDVHVCAPESDKSFSGHSVSVRETMVASSVEINGSTGFEVTGTTVDCVSLGLSGSLFSWMKPTLVISGIDKGLCCGQHSFYSGVFAGAMEAFLCGVPSLSISLNWKKDESEENNYKEAVDVCLPLINAAIRDIDTGLFPKDCFLNINVPTFPKTNKGIKVTEQSSWRCNLNWQGVSGNRHPSAHYISKHQTHGIQLAQISRDASAAGAARRVSAQRKTVEVESVASAGKSESQDGNMKKYFRLEVVDKEQEETGENLDFRAVELGFVSVTPMSFLCHAESAINSKASDWVTSVFTACEEILQG